MHSVKFNFQLLKQYCIDGIAKYWTIYEMKNNDGAEQLSVELEKEILCRKAQFFEHLMMRQSGRKQIMTATKQYGHGTFSDCISKHTSYNDRVNCDYCRQQINGFFSDVYS